MSDDTTSDFNWYMDRFRMDVIMNYRVIEPEMTWSAYLDVPGSKNNQCIYLGTYSTKEEAIEARDEAEKGLSSYGDRDLWSLYGLS